MIFPATLASSHRWLRRALLLGLGVLAGSAASQEIVDGKRPMVTRAQLQAGLQEAEAITNSGAYSDAFREQKRGEAAKVRERLIEGDFFVGDQIDLRIDGDSLPTGGIQTVRPGRVLSIQGLPDVTLRGVLRSELQGHLTEQLARFYRNPAVSARPLIRLTILGGVVQPGFHQLDADMILSDALTAAGGISAMTDLPQSRILRDDQELLGHEEFAKAITDGRSLDELDLRAGDVIDVGVVKTTNWQTTLRTVMIIPALIISIYGLGSLFNVW